MGPRANRSPNQDKFDEYATRFARLSESSRWAEALEVILKMHDLTPENPDILYKMGTVYFQL
jgi:tetratricopeptide (TPR) repeat protein